MNPLGDFCPSHGIAEGEIRSILWKDTGQTVSENGYVIGLPPQIRKSLLEYCNDMGITQILQELTYGSRETHPQEDTAADIDIRLNGLDWFIQRAHGNLWKSDMHWISPSDARSQSNYLEALGRAGFDQVLQAIGYRFNYQGLVAYHLSVIAVSHCVPGCIHVDATNTGARCMNIIIPLLLAQETGPELLLQENTSSKSGGYRYEYDVAALVGDDCLHGTNSVNYRAEMRMAATVFVADVSCDNIHAVLDDYVTYDKHYPPRSQPEILLNQAKAHWHRDDPLVKLPTGQSKNMNMDDNI